MAEKKTETDPCQHCGRWSVVRNSRGQLICERCLGEQFDWRGAVAAKSK